MKKISIIIVALFSLISSAANAKTQGNYLGLNLLRTEVELDGIISSEPTIYDKDKSRDDRYSVGFNYRYALNFNKFFVAPEVFFDFNQAKTRVAQLVMGTPTYSNFEIKNSVGAKLNLGYDIKENFALYGFFGHSINRVRFHTSVPGFSDSFGLEYFNQEAFIYGLGAKLDLTKRLSLNLSYEMAQFGLSNDVFNTTDEINPDFHVAKLGLAYNF